MWFCWWFCQCLLIEIGWDGHGYMARALALELPGGVQLTVADKKQAALAANLMRALAKPC